MKHNRVLVPLTIFLAACVGSQPAEAGVIVDSNGIVTEFTETSYSQNTYYFYEGSYDSTSSTSATTVGSDGTTQFFFGNDFASALANYSGPETLDTTVSYAYAYDDTTSAVKLNEVRHNGVGWGYSESVSYAKTAKFNILSQTFYFASLTAPTGGSTGTVPEPSTAIAMGLLGVVGFAGNRRRRRQVSAA